MKNILLLLFIFSVSAFNIDTYPQSVNDNVDLSAKPLLHWKYRSAGPLFSSPVIHENTVYFGSADSVFHALDLESGRSLWEFKTGGSIFSRPLISGDRIYLNGGDGNLYCFDMKGDLIRTIRLGSEKKYDFADYHQSSPVEFDNAVYLGLGDGFIYKINPEIGTVIWKYETGGIVHSTPAADSSGVYAGSFDGYVYALNTDDGSLKWKFKTNGHRYFPKGEVQGSPSVNDEIVFIGARDYNFYAIDKEKGYCHWNRVFSKGWVLTNSLIDTLLFLEGADERILSAADPNTGKDHWKRDMEFLMFGKPAFSKTMLYTGTTIGKLHAVNIHTGQEIWTFNTDGYNENRYKYFKEDDSYRDDIYDIIRSNEQFLDVEIELGGIFSSPCIDNGYLVFTSSDGNVYCLRSP
ncbi:MAG TPA: PQQ-binding-like beta-propeller repeat protein [Ignavibacteria bacterium]|nr:PQQ-binding-like beta-propeller repeat protein [Ignavibacteria bacterium]HMR39959.1 PQQ-binding-like beta-propeller repeat protein [Ignavibacteria bacterium]